MNTKVTASPHGSRAYMFERACYWKDIILCLRCSDFYSGFSLFYLLIKFIVCRFLEPVQVKVHRYWPAKHPANIGTLVVEMTNEMAYDDYTMREIKLTNTKV